MSSQQPRITLRPPPHRDYLTGYPGIPASDPSTDAQPTFDPLHQLPHVLRPQAHLTGTVEIRSPAKGGPIRAKWLSLELEKIECVPAPPPPSSGSQAQENGTGRGAARDGRFVELIGTGPNKLWVAGESESAVPVRETGRDSPRKKGLKAILKSGGGGPSDREDEDDGYAWIPDGNYPFKIPLPEGLPPTIEVDSKLNGVSYQIVASLCCKGKKGILKGAHKPAIFVASAPVLLNKADILPTWPAYQPVLPTPLPPKLPWAAPPGELTVGETKESKLVIRRDDGTAGEVWMKATRQGAGYGPGDAVNVFVQLGWGGEKPIKLTRLDFVLRETLTFRYPSPANPNYITRAPPRVSSLFTANASVSPDVNNPTAFAVLYQNEPVAFDLTGIVPSSHMRVTVRTAKHVDVAYHLKVRAMIEGGDEVAVDAWPVVIGNVSSRVAKGIMADIGYVEGLCERAGLVPTSAGSPQSEQTPSFSPPLISSNLRRSLMPPSPSPALSPPPVEHDPSLPYVGDSAADEKSRLLEARNNMHVSNPSPTPALAPPSLAHPLHTLSGTNGETPERSMPIRPTFIPSPTAEEEKRRYYEEATRSRDALQSSVRSKQDNGYHTSPTSTDVTQQTREAPVTPTTVASPSTVNYHEAAVLRRSLVQNGVSRNPPPRADSDPAMLAALAGSNLPVTEPPTLARGYLSSAAPVARSSTMMALSGSDVSDAPPPSPPPSRSPPPTSPSLSAAALLGRSLTTAEAEKKRLFLDARETARRRQEEARVELERQNRLLEEIEFEEAQRDFEERLVAEAEAELRDEERRKRETFEASQKEVARLEEEKWVREEELRRARAVAELEEKKRQAEIERLNELKRFEEQQRAAEEARAAEIARQAAERKREDEAKRAKAEELRRIDAERQREDEARRVAVARKAEMERVRAEDEQRRLVAEQARREEEERRRQQAEVEEQRRRMVEAEAQRLYEEEHRRHEEEQSRRAQEDYARRAYEENVRRGQEELARQAADEARRMVAQRAAQASSPAYLPPGSYGHPSYAPITVRPAPSVPHHVADGIERAHSVASFAPSMSAAAADSAFYAQAIARSGSALSEEKAAYLRQLRQQEEERRSGTAAEMGISSSQPSQSRQLSQSPAPPSTLSNYSFDPSTQSHIYAGYHSQPYTPPQPAYPQPPLPPQPPSAPNGARPSRQNTYDPSLSATPKPQQFYRNAPSAPSIPDSPSYSPPVPAPATSSSAAPSMYKTAAEEKEEMQARRRAEDERQQQQRSKQPAPVEDADDLPPSYPVQGSATARDRSAAEEKAELQSYYAAKAAVDERARQPPPLPPSRQASAPPEGYDHPQHPQYAAQTPAPVYQPSSSAPPSQPPLPSIHENGSSAYNGPAYPAAYSPDPSQPQRQATNEVLQDRDPSVSAGKQRAQRPATASSDDYSDSIIAGYVYPPQPHLPPQQERQRSSPDDRAREDAQDVAFARSQLETGFPEFDRLAGEIEQANQARMNGGA
ncbi:hypothetical protein JCM5296_001610 [Sporobolomyces johnsonii]